MKINFIETVRVSDPADVIWVRVHTDTGLIGLGETWYASKTVESAVHDHFAPLVVGRDPFAIERHWLNMFRLSDHAGYGGAELRALSAIDMALWDIKGQAAGVPVYELLGGAVRKKIRVYATGAPFEGCGELAKELIDDGTIAMKMGPTIPVATPSEGQYLAPKELDRVLKPFRDVRDAVGNDIKIANDGHGKWNLPVAIQIAKEMEPLDIMWQEDLMPLLNPGALRQLQDATTTPVCISERLLTRWQLREFIENGAAQIVMPDLIWTGGISETHRIAVMASAHQVPVAPHDATGPVNIFACAHICMNSPNAMIMEHVRPYLYGWYGDFVDPLPPIEHGWLHAPQNPGIGTRLRPEVFERPDVELRVSDESIMIPGMKIVREMEPLRPMWHEELISPLNEKSHERLQAATSTPIAAAERLMTRYQHRRFIESPAARISMPDLTWTGGISEIKKIAILASAHQMPIAPHDCVGPVNMLACAHIAMATPNVMIMEYNRAMHLGWYRDFIEPDFVIEDGFLIAPTEPGLGTRLKSSVRDRQDVSIRTSNEKAEAWLMSSKRYTYPPPELQEEFLNSTDRRRAGSKAVYYD